MAYAAAPCTGLPAATWTIRWSSTKGNLIELRWPLCHPQPTAQRAVLRYLQHNFATWTIRWSSTKGNLIELRWPLRHPQPTAQHVLLRYLQHNFASRMPRCDQFLRFLCLLQRKDITHQHLHVPGVNQGCQLLQLLDVRL
jgi:hypothetical protein